MVRINLILSPAQAKMLDRIGTKLSLDRTNALRYCISRIAEIEKVKAPPLPAPRATKSPST